MLNRRQPPPCLAARQIGWLKLLSCTLISIELAIVWSSTVSSHELCRSGAVGPSTCGSHDSDHVAPSHPQRHGAPPAIVGNFARWLTTLPGVKVHDALRLVPMKGHVEDDDGTWAWRVVASGLPLLYESSTSPRDKVGLTFSVGAGRGQPARAGIVVRKGDVLISVPLAHSLRGRSHAELASLLRQSFSSPSTPEEDSWKRQRSLQTPYVELLRASYYASLSMLSADEAARCLSPAFMDYWRFMSSSGGHRPDPATWAVESRAFDVCGGKACAAGQFALLQLLDMLNHRNFDPTAKYVMDRSNATSPSATFVAARDIADGEEVTWRYLTGLSATKSVMLYGFFNASDISIAAFSLAPQELSSVEKEAGCTADQNPIKISVANGQPTGESLTCAELWSAPSPSWHAAIVAGKGTSEEKRRRRRTAVRYLCDSLERGVRPAFPERYLTSSPPQAWKRPPGLHRSFIPTAVSRDCLDGDASGLRESKRAVLDAVFQSEAFTRAALDRNRKWCGEILPR